MAVSLRDARVAAILGPTNTGKTHRAIERMLSYRSGMIGLPLRLLAREVYDRVVEQRGPECVALITGEERRVPRDAQYLVCTVEAMPVDRRVAFLAVDEIQLAGDRNRGHTFTDRLLHARGTEETWFLGSATIAPLMERLIPGVAISSAPRLSRLSWAGTRKLASVPPRSAVIAFSAERVYETAERLRAVHGGAAVVLGALSPRTRNAQVAMYQAGEVGHLVATDAIGMGLNMDLQHVAFTEIRKFDGRGTRELSAAELAQIAGRAGRYKTDGTFGSTRELGDLDPDLVEAIESHTFPPLTGLYWRDSDLDLSTPASLLRGLRRPPPSRLLIAAPEDEDLRALEALSLRPEVVERAVGPAAVGRLWEICRVPDYRKTRTESHVELLAQVAVHLLGEPGVLPDDFVGERIDRLDRTDGDIETLMSRIAWIRTWTYVAWQPDWTARPSHWQERTREVEDRLSDALHERLTARFVDRRVTLLFHGTPTQVPVTVEEGGEVRVGGLPVGRVRDLSFEPGDAPPTRAALAALRRRLRSDVITRVEALIGCDDDEIVLRPDARLEWQGASIARLEPGPSVLEPKVLLHRLDLLEPAEREQVRVRLDRWRDGYVAGLFAPLDRDAAGALGADGRGVVWILRSSLGTVGRAAVDDALGRLKDKERTALARLDVRVGVRSVFVQSLLKRQAMRRRAALWAVFRGVRPLPEPPPDGRSSVLAAGADLGALGAMGYLLMGPLAIRADVLERVDAEARSLARETGAASLERVTSWLGCRRDEAVEVLSALGYRVRGDPVGPVRVRREGRP